MHNLRSRAAFTLLEILITLAILGLLVGLAVSHTGNTLQNANRAAASIAVRDTYKGPLTQYRLDLGDYPSTAEGMQALVTAPSNHADRWHGPYVDVPGGKLPLDPWGEPYVYHYPGVKNKGGFDLSSKGPDKIEGTDDDIGNW